MPSGFLRPGYRRVRAAQPPAAPTVGQARIVRAVRQAWEASDIGALIGLLDPDATLTGDGGAALRPIEGREQVARFLADIAAIRGKVELPERTVNGQPGLVAQQDGVTVVVDAFEIADGRIVRIWAILNPGKLRPWAAS